MLSSFQSNASCCLVAGFHHSQARSLYVAAKAKYHKPMSQLYTATAHMILLSLSSAHLSPMLLLLLEWACQSFIVLPMTGPLGLHGVPLHFMRVSATTFYHKWNLQSVRSQQYYDNKEKQISFLVVDLIAHLSHSSRYRLPEPVIICQSPC